MKVFFRHVRAIKHSVGSEDAIGETVGSECTCILYLHTVLAYCTCILYLHTVLPRASPGPRKELASLDPQKKKKKSWEKEEASAPIREPLNQRQTAEPPFSQVSPIARDEKLIFIKNARSCAF